MTFDKFLIRAITIGDMVQYFELIDSNRKRLEDFFAGTVSKNKSIEDTSVFINNVIDKAEKKTYFGFVIVDGDTEQLIGYIDIKSIDWNVPKAELGYFIDKNYEGSHISTRAVSLIVDHCFKTLHLVKLFLRTHAENAGSRKVAERNGFTIEGNIRKDYKTTKGDIIDVLYYGLVNEL